jgi:sugar lactone lactonase YvrE
MGGDIVKLTSMVLSALVLGTALALSVASASAQSAPSPTAGTELAGDLISPRGMKIGPDGMIYVAEAGSAGDKKVTNISGDSTSGLTGRISRIDPVTGARTTVADKLPSDSGFFGPVGPADVAFLGAQLYFLQTAGGAAFGFPENPTGVYRVNKNGTVTLFADIGAFNDAHPVTFTLLAPGGNPFGITVLNGDFYVTDGNFNRVLHITPDGKIDIISSFENVVPTGITGGADGGGLYVAALGPGPWLPSDGRVYQVGVPTGNITEIANGVSSMIDVEAGPGGQLYGLSFGDFGPGADDPPWIRGSAKLVKVDAASHTLTPIATGFSLSTALIFSGDTAYVTNYGVSVPGSPGEIWKIDNVSSLKALALPEPTKPAAPTPRSVIAAPNTGTGGATGGGSWLATLLIIGAAGVALVVAAKRVGGRRDA